MRRNFDAFVAGAEHVNTDDEHDPEGATIAFERAQVIALRNEAAGRLEAIDRALAGLDAGTYGRCAVCGGPIGVERLLALPGVDACVGCAR
jgi:RNA polymerase-binding transcription factor DksA